jgi:23S rRNA (adenine2503-C2)-methyltransferase
VTTTQDDSTRGGGTTRPFPLLISEERAPTFSLEGAQRVDFLSLSRAALGTFVTDTLGESIYRRDQLFDGIHRQGHSRFESLSTISRSLKERVVGLCEIREGSIAERHISNDGTRKYLIDVGDGVCVEAVMIKQPSRMTLCVSSQVGCGMGCGFCRTATMGFKRNLSLGDIVRQVRVVREDAKNFNDKFTNVVFMGMGEPLHNLDAVIDATHVLTDPLGYEIAPRRVTVSTVGLVPAIRVFGERSPANLAVSLNATTNEVRSKIMPINNRFPLEVLLDTLRKYPLRSRDKITIEYVMLAGVNDSPDDLQRIPKILKGIPSKINLIPYNENAQLGFSTPAEKWIYHWRDQLLKARLPVTIRWSKGVDISAACGQLASQSGKREPIPARLLHCSPSS